MLKLPVYFRKNTYYFHTRIGGVQFKRSLRTSDPLKAKLIPASHVASTLMAGAALGDLPAGHRDHQHDHPRQQLQSIPDVLLWRMPVEPAFRVMA